MKLYVDLSTEEKYKILQRTPTHSESFLTVYSEEGIFDVRNKIHKQVLLDDKPSTRQTVEGRTVTLDSTVFVPKEMWQIPYPNHTVARTIHTYNLDDDLSCVVDFNPDATFYFLSSTVEKPVEWILKNV